jgi:hypothetical protein
MGEKTPQEHVAKFKAKLFARGKRYQELFRKLHAQGCETNSLCDLLFAVCTLADADSKGILPPLTPSAAEVKKLVTDLRSLSESVGRINGSLLNPKYSFLWAPPDPTRDLERNYVASRYDTLPGLMMVYALNLEQFFKFTRAQLKRMTLTHFFALQLLLHVELSTGSPRYEDMSELLTAGFLVSGGTEVSIPKAFSADALAKLRQRKVSRLSAKA